MGILGRANRKIKEDHKKAQEDLENRAKQFMVEFKMIRARYRCDIEPFLKFIDDGDSGIVPMVRIIDCTEKVAQEEEAERKIREEQAKKEYEAKTKKTEETNGNKENQNIGA